MKKLSWKGFTATIMALTVMSSMAACSSGANSTTSTSKADSTETAQTPVPTDAAPVTIKIYGPKISGAASGVQSDEVAKEIEKRLGIIMDIDPNPEDNKLNLMLAGGELPDLFMVSKDKIKQLVEGNNVIPMDELLDKYGKSITSESNKKVDFSRKYFSNGTGKLYFLQGHDGLPSVASGGDYYGNQFTIRWDYYKELGYPALETQEDLLKVTKQIQDKHPTNELGKKTYGISPFFEWGMWPLTQHGIYTAGKGMTSEFIDVLPDVTFKSSILEQDSSLWTGAAFNNKAYQMGLLDPDSMTQKFDNANEKSNSNRVQLGVVQWMFDQANQGFAKNQEMKGYMNIPPIERRICVDRIL